MKPYLPRILVGLAAFWAARPLSATPSYVNRVPNATVSSCSTCHTSPPALNAFGNDFLTAGLAWTPALAVLDSDADGSTNGQELGDPFGTGAAVAGWPVTAPGDAASHPPVIDQPPTITTQPASQTVTAGSNAQFTVAATGTPPFAYQWQLGGIAITGATSATLTVPAATSADVGLYSALVANPVGIVTSAGAQLAIGPAATAPTITTQPLTQTVTAGTNAALTVVAAGTAPLSYQWMFNGVSIPGATGDTLALTAVAASAAGSYTVVVGNSAGSVTSAVAVLTVNPVAVGPIITTSPVGQTVTEGTTVLLTVVASGTAPLSYQWTFNGTDIPGATSDTLTLNAVTTAQSGIYAVIVSNSVNSVTSGPALLTVRSAAVAPTITTQPANQTVLEGSTVAFTVAAAGSGTLTYQWQKAGAAISTATGDTLTLVNVTAADNGVYTVVVANPAGSATSDPATLTVTPAPPALNVVLTNPPDAAVFTAPATFTLAANATPVASIARVDFYQDTTLIGTVTTAPFSFTVNTLGAGTYSFTAQATDTSGATALSAAVSVTVTAPPPSPGSATVTVTAPMPEANEVGPVPGQFTITRTGDTSNPLTVYYLLSGTAVNGADYQTLDTNVTIPAGSFSATLTVTPIRDVETPTELADTVILQLTGAPADAQGYDIGTPGSAIVTITEAPPPPLNQPPVVRIVAPREVSRFRTGADIALAARATDPDGTVTSVTFSAGGTTLGSARLVTGEQEEDGASAPSRAVYVFVWHNVPAGHYLVTATATDNLGATTISAPVNITVANRDRRGDDGGGGD